MEQYEWKVEFIWIKAHAGYRGNELPDQLTKEAASSSDLWCLLLRPGLEPVPAEYQPFDRVTSSSICVTVVNLRAMKGYEGGIAVFIFNILVRLSGQLRAPAFLVLGKYSPVVLAGERWLSGFTEAVSRLSRRDK